MDIIQQGANTEGGAAGYNRAEPLGIEGSTS